MTNNGADRRTHVRLARNLDFYCYVEGQRFDSQSLDVSAGGAFLVTSDEFEVGNTVLVVPKAEKDKGLTGLLVGAVVRVTHGPEAGLGIQWKRCVSRSGYETIHHFLSSYLEVDRESLLGPSPAVMESELVTYDFGRNLMYIPGTPTQSATTASPVTVGMLTAEELSPRELSKGEDPGIVTLMLGSQGGRVPVDVPVQFYLGDVIMSGLLKAVGLTSAFLATDALDETGEGACVVSLPVPLVSGPVQVKLFCSILAREEGELLGYKGYDLAIQSVEDEPEEGLFHRYVKYLFDRLFSQGP